MSVIDLEGALILISCDTTELDDASVGYNRVLPYTVRYDALRNFELDGEIEDIDSEFDMDSFDERPLWAIDLEDFSTVEDVAMHILGIEGRELIDAFYYDEELVVDNKMTITIYNHEREPICTYTEVFHGIDRDNLPEAEPELEPYLDLEAFKRSLDIKSKMDEKGFIEDRRIVLFHLALLVGVTALVWWMCYEWQWTTFGCWFVSIISGLYVTQLWWSNAPRTPLGCLAYRPRRRAKGRPWINGGLIVGVLFSLVSLSLQKFFPEYIPETPFDQTFFFGLFIAICTTLSWGFLVYVNREFGDGQSLLETFSKFSRDIDKTTRRIGRRHFLREFFSRMLFWRK